MDLKAIYLTTLERCAPERLVRERVDASMPRNVVAIGKCAGPLLDGVAAVIDIGDAFVVIPEGYPLPSSALRAPSPRKRGEGQDWPSPRGSGERVAEGRVRGNVEIHAGGHPYMTPSSFAAGQALLAFIDAHEDILFLISGGGSACVEVALPPHTEEEVASRNASLIASGMPIAAINAERRKLSAIKGGRLRRRVRGRSVTLVYSDVSRDALADVASGPTITSSEEAILIADNTTLTSTAANVIGERAVVLRDEIECDVAEAVSLLSTHLDRLRPGQILVAGGEPTVRVRGEGHGGRCSELAVRFAMRSNAEAIFASSDGVDGNSGAAGIYLPRRWEVSARPDWEEALRRSDSFPVAMQVGEPIMITPTGNNLRDLFLVARD